MAYSFSADSARRKAFDDDAVQDEINYITAKIIEAVGKGIVVDGNTKMTGRSARADFSGIAGAKTIASISPSANCVFAVACEGHDLEDADHVMVTGVTDSTLKPLINDSVFVANVIDDGAFEIFRRHFVTSSIESKSLDHGRLNVIANREGNSATVTIYLDDHGYSANDEVEIRGIEAGSAVHVLDAHTASVINAGKHTVLSTPDGDSFQFELSGKSNLSSTRLQRNFASGSTIEIWANGSSATVIIGGTGFAGHGFAAGDPITISGIASSVTHHELINGNHDIERASANNFSFAISSSTNIADHAQVLTGGGATVSRQGKISITAGSVIKTDSNLASGAGGRGSFFKVPVTVTGDADAKEYRKVWKGDNIVDDIENSALTRHMDAVIRHFRDRGYTILRKDNGGSGRVTGVADDRADTFQWEITW